jgi:hypothetical protein
MLRPRYRRQVLLLSVTLAVRAHSILRSPVMSEVARPGTRTDKTLAEVLGVTPDSPCMVQLREDFAAIRDAERQAWLITRDIYLTGGSSG